jgi:hypothetical protein
MVFAVMVIFLVYRVVLIVRPPIEKDIVIPSPPGNGQVAVPLIEDLPEKIFISPITSGLTRRNPFWYYGQALDGTDSDDPDAIQLELERIMETPRGFLAMIKSKGGRARGYKEGEPFENYRVEKIDNISGTVDVFDESKRNTVTLTVPTP